MKPRSPVSGMALAGLCALLFCSCAPARTAFAGAASANARAKLGVVLVTDGSPAGLEARRELEDSSTTTLSGNCLVKTMPEGIAAKDLATFLLGLAGDPGLGAIILHPAPEDSAAALARVRAARPGILLLVGSPVGDPLELQAVADLIVAPDLAAIAWRAAREARAAGASSLLLLGSAEAPTDVWSVRLRAALGASATTLGLAWREERLPAGTAETRLGALARATGDTVSAGSASATAWFCEDAALTEALIGMIVAKGGFYVGSPSPSPWLGFPVALGLTGTPDARGIVAALDRAARTAGAAGRLSVWPRSADGSIAAALGEIARRALIAQEAAGRPATATATTAGPGLAEFRIDSLEEIAAALRAVAPGPAWELSWYVDPATGIKARNHVLLRLDDQVLGKGPAGEKGEPPAELRLLE